MAEALWKCPLCGGKRGIKNAGTFREILRKANSRHGNVRLCLNGHLHIDDLRCVEDVLYYTVNSISNLWMGQPYSALHYSRGLHEQYPNLAFVAPYQVPLFAIITLTRGGISVTGRTGRFVPPSWAGPVPPRLPSTAGIYAGAMSPPCPGTPPKAAVYPPCVLSDAVSRSNAPFPLSTPASSPARSKTAEPSGWGTPSGRSRYRTGSTPPPAGRYSR